MLNSCTKLSNDEVQCSSMDWKSGEYYQELLGEERELVLLFLDIRNYTQLMEQHSVYQVLHATRKILTFSTMAIEKAGGKIVEVSGDNIYAVFGADGEISSGAQAAMTASGTIFSDLSIFNEQQGRAADAIKIELGIGIHHGKVVVGHSNLDSNGRMTVTGLAVNIASRLQAETRVINNSLLISQQTYALLNLQEDAYPSQIVRLKGITTPLLIRLMGQPYDQLTKYKCGDLEMFLYMAG